MSYDPRPERQTHHQSRGWQGFTFLGGTVQAAPAVSPQHSGGEFDPFPLSQAQTGDRLWVVDISAGEGLLERLVSMGINRGVELEVISRGGGGSLMVAVANTRLGLGAGMAQRIQVQRIQVQRSSPTALHKASPSEDNGREERLYLRQFCVGSQGRITGYEPGSASYRQKLLAMGLTPGTEFTITRQAPLGDPVELRVRGFQLSLRKAEADALRVEAIGHG